MDKKIILDKEKRVIWNIAFYDMDKNNCFIDLYLDEKISAPQNKLVSDFLNKCNNELLNVKYREQPLILRKYSYENILNMYLEKKYKIDNIGLIILENKENNKEKTIKRYDSTRVLYVKEKYANQLADEIGLDYKKIRKIENKYQEKCPYFDENKCSLLEKECSVFWENCVRNADYLHKIRRIAEEKQIKQEQKKRAQQEKERKKRIELKIQEQGKRRLQEKEPEKTLKNPVQMSPAEIKLQILKIKNPKAWEFLNNVSRSEKTDIDDLIIIYERVIRQCNCHKNGMCVITRSKCDISQKDCFLHKQFIEGIRANKKKGIVVNKTSNRINTSSKYQINIKDFVVRRSVFKCMHEHHIIENIDAQVAVDSDGKKELIQIPAGYCRQCNTYFIMESTYQELKRKGIILCRITDEKTYMKSLYVNGMQLAQESVLMQYGYNVSQIEGLSQRTRQKILALLIDNKALSKSEIISYLDFFINQRAGRSNMQIAISKWEADREFVENYRIGEYTKYGVNAIYRR